MTFPAIASNSGALLGRGPMHIKARFFGYPDSCSLWEAGQISGKPVNIDCAASAGFATWQSRSTSSFRLLMLGQCQHCSVKVIVGPRLHLLEPKCQRVDSVLTFNHSGTAVTLAIVRTPPGWTVTREWAELDIGCAISRSLLRHGAVALVVQ